ncbi:carboxypeptidase-1 [Coleophoma cylindrospora]|uniref:Carboxypeptidase n=1 Tax=Coleophoma cylindrospora TaxID=1849047 RepID=A0A3D8RHJ1_9HELO|nr:carboxypeptidase-1 [Coleophoma cylindrospora]
MHTFGCISLLLAASAATALHSPHDRVRHVTRSESFSALRNPTIKPRSTSKYLTNATTPFAVNGSALPEFDFDIGESYAGSLSISSNATDENKLWFWFFPSSNPLAAEEITIWLNGGPGCSSLNGLFQENGPFLWQSGTYAPVPNPYSWVNLTNMIYIDQPVSTGFSQGTINVTDEVDVASQFKGFWKNFIDTFAMEGYKIYITGESYAGQYIPYIASGMLDENNTGYFNCNFIAEYGSMLTLVAPSVPALLKYQNVMNLNQTFLDNITARADACGFTAFHDLYTTTFPPPGPIPTAPDSTLPGCGVWDDIYNAAYYVNPCFNIYHLTDFCPFLWDQLGFPSLGAGPNNYFNQSDVQKVIHAPPTDYAICAGGSNLFPEGDLSVPSGLGPLPSVIERTNNTIIGHGDLDFLLFTNGTLITIQNMTWNGLQGFQTAPSAEQNLFVPYHETIGEILDLINGAIAYTPGFTDTAGGGYQGTYHTERGLTFVTVALAGHEIPQYVPGAAYRQLEFLLGRIDNLGQRGDYTTGPQGNYTGVSAPQR